MFVVATERDHVSPWESVYKIHQLVRSPVSFALSSGGHNMGIVNPPAGPLAQPKASYRFASNLPGKAPADPRLWLDAASEHKGSWWPRWEGWLQQHQSEGRIKPPQIEALLQQGQPLAAPGTYVQQR
jgi:polyhydroxyalkanoate synthase